jgi:hypothetical protein
MEPVANPLQFIWYGFGGSESLLIGIGLLGAFLCSLTLISKGAKGNRATLASVVLVGFLATALAPGWVFVRKHGPGGNGVLARLLTTDGAECRVVQIWNDWAEPYTVSFFFRPPSGDWGWCYIDHEDHRWTRCELELDDQRHKVRIFESGRLRAELDLRAATFSLFDEGGECRRTLPAPQELRVPPL